MVDLIVVVAVDVAATVVTLVGVGVDGGFACGSDGGDC